MDVSTLNSTMSSGTATSSNATANQTASADRFLKLLVTQMQNQDPLNPMDNAQVTSQMAQINTVEGITTLNQTVQGLNTQFVQLQALQGASLVGRSVLLQGSQLSIANGQGQGSFDLSGPADHVQAQILSPSGAVVDTVDLGAQSSGRHDFSWPSGSIDPNAGLTFKIVAKSGAADVPATPLMRDTVDSVSIDGDQLSLLLARSGDVPYSQVKGFD
jgi:flagellar basal-body rod modification protein FlgD